MAEESNQQDPIDSAPANDDLSRRAEEARYARRTATTFGVAAGVVALVAAAAGIAQHGTLALWCAPLFLWLGLVANSANKNARLLTKGPGEAQSIQSITRQAGEGCLLVVLALLFVVVLFFVWLFACWWRC
jgi:hypothetical protein